jgi:hypothetical protein
MAIGGVSRLNVGRLERWKVWIAKGAGRHARLEQGEKGHALSVEWVSTIWSRSFVGEGPADADAAGAEGEREAGQDGEHNDDEEPEKNAIDGVGEV